MNQGKRFPSARSCVLRGWAAASISSRFCVRGARRIRGLMRGRRSFFVRPSIMTGGSRRRRSGQRDDMALHQVIVDPSNDNQQKGYDQHRHNWADVGFRADIVRVIHLHIVVTPASARSPTLRNIAGKSIIVKDLLRRFCGGDKRDGLAQVNKLDVYGEQAEPVVPGERWLKTVQLS